MYGQTNIKFAQTVSTDPVKRTAEIKIRKENPVKGWNRLEIILL
jgi:hypothetical protein